MRNPVSCLSQHLCRACSSFTVQAAALLSVVIAVASNAQAETKYEEVAVVLTKYCAGCHNETEAENKFRVDDFALMMAGGEHGAVINTQDTSSSKLLGILDGTVEPKMPPEDEPQPTAEELALIRSWISGGAKGPAGKMSLRDAVSSGIASQRSTPSNRLCFSLAIDSDKSPVVNAYDGRVEIVSSDGQLLHKIDSIVGRVTSIRRAAGERLIVASGVPGFGGQITIVDVASGNVELQFDAHSDMIYAATMNQAGTLIASGGYDKEIILWDASTGQKVAQLSGHNGAIYDLDFDSAGKLLCSASADETIKLWHVEKRERLDTFSQCEGEQYICRFSPDGQRVYAAGSDRPIRCWQIINRETPEVNPMQLAVFAHEGAVTQLAFVHQGKSLVSAGQDHLIKLWDTQSLQPLGIIGKIEGLPLSMSTVQGDKVAMVTSNRNATASFEIPTNNYSPSEQNSSMAATQKVGSEAAPTEFKDAGNNNSIETAQAVSLPAMIAGTIASESGSNDSAVDNDYFRFTAEAGQPWVFTVIARKDGSPLDSRIEILQDDGQSVLRTRLQAIRETYFTFRAKNSTQSDDYRLHRWEDMDLNQLIYANGEVNKFWLWPRGPDSGFFVYPGSGFRQTYFDTTASTHALNEPAYIVTELAPDEAAAPNGLPVFPIYYENDDDADRKLDKDSQLYFTAPVSGTYLLRISDARDLQGDDFKYRIEVRSPKPRFELSAKSSKPLHPGTGTELEISTSRYDNFDGPIELELEGLSEGLTYSRPLFIERDQINAVATIYAAAELEGKLPEQFSVTVHGTAVVDGQNVKVSSPQSVEIKVSKDKLIMPRLVASGGDHDSPSLQELIIHPGETITANVVLEGGENKVEYGFGTEDSNRNFPHGIIISNIGLNGLLLPAGQTNRQFFITAAPWVLPQERPIHLRTKDGQNQTSQPVVLRVVPRGAATSEK